MEMLKQGSKKNYTVENFLVTIFLFLLEEGASM